MPDSLLTQNPSYREVVLTQPVSSYPHHLIRYLLCERLGLNQGTVVDLGCGRGDHGEAMRSLGFHVIAIDQERGDHVQHVCDFGKDPIPLLDESVDVVFSKSVIEHLYLPQIKHYLSEIKRILKPGGSVILLTPDWIYCAYDFYDGYTHVTPFTKRSLGQALTMAGLKEVQIENLIALPITWHSRFFKCLANLTRCLPLRSLVWNKWVRWSNERQVLGFAKKGR